MDWRDHGYVLTARRHGEGDAILTLFTRGHGRHLGLMKGGASRAKRPFLESGNLVAASWRARLSEQLGHFQVEPLRAIPALFLNDPARLSALLAACAAMEAALPEREPHAEIYDDLTLLIETLEAARADWPAEYVRWETRLLGALGFGLDLARCALTGAGDDLAYVSPGSGRAASREAGEAYRDKLLALPRFLVDPATPPTPDDLAAGLRLTGHFLETHVFAHSARPGLGEARRRMVELLCRDHPLGCPTAQ